MNPSITTVFLAAIFAGFSFAEDSVKEAKTIVISYIDLQGVMSEAIKFTESEKDLEVFSDTVAEISKRMMELADELAALGPFNNTAVGTLWSTKATREFEVIGDENMAHALQSVPQALRPKVMRLLQENIQKLQGAEESIAQSLSKSNTGPRRQRIAVPLEGKFVATVGSAHVKDAYSDPTIAIVFSIFSQHRVGASVVLFEQTIPWSGETPDDDTFKSWISYSSKTRAVTFTYPSGSFTHSLPKKRLQNRKGN